jgi:dipeptidyl aminopeptidase/acylaminoacyl peptidase
MKRFVSLLFAAFAVAGTPCAAADAPPDYVESVAPILQKYCVGCHNAEDRDGELSLATFAELQRGGEHGPAVLPGDAKTSRMIRLVTGQAEPRMPPEDSKAPTEAEIAVIRNWIEAGARGPAGAEPARTKLVTPRIAPAENAPAAVAAIDWSPTEDLIAVGRFRTVELRSAADDTVVRTLSGHPGKVNSLQFSPDGSRLIAGTGVVGLYGRVVVWNVANGEKLREWDGHRDALYAAVLSPDGKLLATAGYDRQIILWDLATGERRAVLAGHNDAVYDLAFSPDGALLASASGDETVKIWRVDSGQRLDTLGQPTAEQYTVAFSPDGKFVAAGGADNRVRVWRVVSRTKQRINPLLYARFAHEGAVVRLAFSPDGGALVSTAEDKTIKAWQTRTFTETQLYESQPDVAAALAIGPRSDTFVVGRMDGSLARYPLTNSKVDSTVASERPVVEIAPATGDLIQATEREPNDTPESATPIALPATVAGVIHSPDENSPDDVDLYRFATKAGQQWMLETNAARSKSPLDSKLEVLDADGQPVLRMLMQAVRDSYVTFRGIDSSTRDCRLHNWQEMQQNDYVYLQGEVVRLYLPPRGPDSGFFFYPQRGNRRSYFDTSGTTHALQETCYIVRPQPPGADLTPNGLPVFPLYYENDDDGLRRWGSDSRLAFVAPTDGEYLVRVSDVRGFAGKDFKYTLSVRPARPSFSVRLEGTKPQIGLGTGQEFKVVATRNDGFDGEIRVSLDGLPAGLSATTPLVIQSGLDIAYGAIYAAADAKPPSPDAVKAIELFAEAAVEGDGDGAGETVRQRVNGFEAITLDEEPKVVVRLEPAEIELVAGETTTVKLSIERRGFSGRLAFEAIEQNLPHGVIVDNIGLNGVLLPEEKTERTVFLTAAPWVPETSRAFFLRANSQGNPASSAIVVHIRSKESRTEDSGPPEGE